LSAAKLGLDMLRLARASRAAAPAMPTREVLRVVVREVMLLLLAGGG
jgi:hypothetical protein